MNASYRPLVAAATAAAAFVLAAVPVALSASAGKGPPNAGAALADIKKANVAAELGEMQDSHIPALLQACPRVPARAAKGWRTAIHADRKPFEGAFVHREIERHVALGIALLAPDYESSYGATAARAFLAIVHDLNTNLKAVHTFDYDYVKAMDNLEARNCGAAGSNYRAGSGLPAKRILVNADIARLATFIATHP